MGLIQEQHPDRCALFMQWKQMDFPVMVDPLNLLGVSAVPITMLIDEAGVIRAINPRPADLDAFLALPPADTAGDHPAFDMLALGNVGNESDRDGLDVVRRKAHSWAIGAMTNPEAIDMAIALMGSVTKADDEDAWSHFKRGVLYRMRFDLAGNNPSDFAKAVAHWERALEFNPNQYIWRRRIQQYGPRLDKPYPFYDWVESARSEIIARGETPTPIAIEPAGSELAQPMREPSPASDTTAPSEPDPEGRISRDDGLIDARTILVPATGGTLAYRAHVELRVDDEREAHWNNESGPTLMWIEPAPGWIVSERLISLPPRADAEVSTEPRRVEFEIRPDGSAPPPEGAQGAPIARAYLLSYVCEGAAGTCLYVRKDVEIATP